jgi:ribosomal protein S14
MAGENIPDRCQVFTGERNGSVGVAASFELLVQHILQRLRQTDLGAIEDDELAQDIYNHFGHSFTALDWVLCGKRPNWRNTVDAVTATLESRSQAAMLSAGGYRWLVLIDCERADSGWMRLVAEQKSGQNPTHWKRRCIQCGNQSSLHDKFCRCGKLFPKIAPRIDA